MHRVYMSFFLRNGWQCQFLEEDLKTPLPRKLTFAGPGKLREMYDRFGAAQKTEDRQGFEYGITIGRGGVWLDLNEGQYQKLRV
jgi:hypothetical protein